MKEKCYSEVWGIPKWFKEPMFRENGSDFKVCTRCRFAFCSSREFEWILEDEKLEDWMERLGVVLNVMKTFTNDVQIDVIVPKFSSCIQEIEEKLKKIRDEYEDNSEMIVKDDCLSKEKMWELYQEVNKLSFQYQQQIIEFQSENNYAKDNMLKKSQNDKRTYIQEIDNSLNSIKKEDHKVQEENQNKENWRIKECKDNSNKFIEETKLCREEKDNFSRKIRNFCLLSKFWILFLLFTASLNYYYTEQLNLYKDDLLNQMNNWKYQQQSSL